MDGGIGFVLAGLALTGSPGPATLSIAATGAAFGARRGVPYMAGIVAGMVAVQGVTAAGVVGALLAVPGAAPVVAGLAAVYFLHLALRIATAPPLSEDGGGAGGGSPPSFAAGFALSLINPKGYAAMAALYSGFVLVPEARALDALVKGGVLTGLMTAADILWLMAGAALTRAFRAPRSNRIVNGVFAVALLVSVGLALLL